MVLRSFGKEIMWDKETFKIILKSSVSYVPFENRAKCALTDSYARFTAIQLVPVCLEKGPIVMEALILETMLSGISSAHIRQ